MSDNQNGSDTKSYENVDTDIEYNEKNDAELDPFEINFHTDFKQDRGPRQPFVNEHEVLIGDHEYQSASSPLENWSTDTDPSVMSGDDWVHPYKDVGFHTAENRELFEQGIPPKAHPFMHPDKDVAYKTFYGEGEDADNGLGPSPDPASRSQR